MEEDDIDALYDPAAEPTDYSDAESTLSAPSSGETCAVKLYGVNDMFITWSASFEERIDRAAPRFAVFGDAQPSMILRTPSSAVHLARLDVDRAIKRLSAHFKSMNAEYFAAHNWALDYVQCWLPIVTDDVDHGDIGLVHIVARRDLTTEQLLGYLLERCLCRFPLIDTCLDANDPYVLERELWRVLIDRATQGQPLATAFNPAHDRSDTLSYSLSHYCGRINTNPHTSTNVFVDQVGAPASWEDDEDPHMSVCNIVLAGTHLHIVTDLVEGRRHIFPYEMSIKKEHLWGPYITSPATVERLYHAGWLSTNALMIHKAEHRKLNTTSGALEMSPPPKPLPKVRTALISTELVNRANAPTQRPPSEGVPTTFSINSLLRPPTGPHVSGSPMSRTNTQTVNLFMTRQQCNDLAINRNFMGKTPIYVGHHAFPIIVNWSAVIANIPLNAINTATVAMVQILSPPDFTLGMVVEAFLKRYSAVFKSGAMMFDWFRCYRVNNNFSAPLDMELLMPKIVDPLSIDHPFVELILTNCTGLGGADTEEPSFPQEESYATSWNETMHPLARTNNYTDFREYARAFSEVQPTARGLLCDAELPENIPDMFAPSKDTYIVKPDAFFKWAIKDGVQNQLRRAGAFSIGPAIGTPPPTPIFLWCLHDVEDCLLQMVIVAHSLSHHNLCGC